MTGCLAACVVLLMLLFDVVQGRTPSDYPVAVWIESPKQNEKIYFYLSENPTFNATVRLRAVHAVGALSLRVFFQGTQVAEVAAEGDTVIGDIMWSLPCVFERCKYRFRSRSLHLTSTPLSKYVVRTFA